jgi:hypothetical protein
VQPCAGKYVARLVTLAPPLAGAGAGAPVDAPSRGGSCSAMKASIAFTSLFFIRTTQRSLAAVNTFRLTARSLSRECRTCQQPLKVCTDSTRRQQYAQKYTHRVGTLRHPQNGVCTEITTRPLATHMTQNNSCTVTTTCSMDYEPLQPDTRHISSPSSLFHGESPRRFPPCLPSPDWRFAAEYRASLLQRSFAW